MAVVLPRFDFLDVMKCYETLFLFISYMALHACLAQRAKTKCFVPPNSSLPLLLLLLLLLILLLL
jgi:hypothetical protein